MNFEISLFQNFESIWSHSKYGNLVFFNYILLNLFDIS